MGGGSSPRMRGKLADRAGYSERHGLIPAHAGKTATMTGGPYSQSAHPRACGENFGHDICNRFEEGSSPRMRGKRLSALFPGQRSGLIPAHAGKTAGSTAANSPKPAHPRACGENNVVVGVHCGFSGSSPRMRGKLGVVAGQVNVLGLIPAHAGKTQ